MPLNFSDPGKVIVPLTRIIVSGDHRFRQIVGFAAVDQMNVIGMYESELGFVSDIAEAVDIRGPAGPQGTVVMEDDTEVVTVKGDEGDPGPTGKSAYEVWQGLGNSGTTQDFLDSLRGSDAAIGDIRASVAQYLVDNPPAAGKDASIEDIVSAVDAWLLNNPPAAGADGEDASDMQVAMAVAAWLNENPPPRGLPGKDATNAQVSDAVSTYMLAHPIPVPADGKNIELQTANGFIQWRKAGDSSWTNLIATSSLVGTPGTNARNVEMQKGATAIQWRLAGDSAWLDLISIAALKGDTGAAGQTLLRQINVTDTATIAITLGVVDKQYACAGAVPGERYLAFIRSFKLNNAASATGGRPAGYYIVAVDCLIADTINIAHMRPAIALGAKYELFTDIVKVNVA